MPASDRPLTRFALVFALAALACLTGCAAKPKPAIDYTRELPPGERALRKLPPEQYPDFSNMQTDRSALLASVRNSQKYLAAPSSNAHFPYLDITHDRAVATLRAMEAILAQPGGVDWNAIVRRDFEVYQSIGAPKPEGAGYTGEVLFTAYCTPIYDASLTRQGEYQWPLYKRPADLVTMDQETGAAGRRTADGRVVAPYYSRVEIERDGKLAGQELVWLKDRWSAYVVTIQGSAQLRLTDGRRLEIGYAGINGHEYASPGDRMRADGVLAGKPQTAGTLRDYFRANPAAMDVYLWANPRTTFFAERPGGPFGKLNVPVTPFATIATDKTVYPRAMPAFLTVPMPAAARNHVGPGNGATPPPPPGTIPFRGFMLDQDTGGAIRAAGRCDIYMGTGPEAEAIAGQQVFAGGLYYLAVKPGAAVAVQSR